MSDKVHNMLRKLIKGEQPVQCTGGTVTKVDELNHTCDVAPLDGGPELYDVRLKPVIDSVLAGVIPVPEAGSFVLVNLIGNNQDFAYVSLCSNITRYIITCDDIRLGGDQHGGLVLINELRSQLNIEKARVSAIINAISSAAVVAGDGGAGFKANLTAALSGVAAPDYSSIENSKVRHG